MEDRRVPYVVRPRAWLCDRVSEPCPHCERMEQEDAVLREGGGDALALARIILDLRAKQAALRDMEGKQPRR